eukprot:5495883-Prymnesium_polylepis.1
MGPLAIPRCLDDLATQPQPEPLGTQRRHLAQRAVIRPLGHQQLHRGTQPVRAWPRALGAPMATHAALRLLTTDRARQRRLQSAVDAAHCHIAAGRLDVQLQVPHDN